MLYAYSTALKIKLYTLNIIYLALKKNSLKYKNKPHNSNVLE